MTQTGQLVRPDVLGPFLAAELGDERWRELSATLIAGGKSNLTFLLSSAAGELVLRRPPDGPVLPTAHDMAREARVQRALHSTPVPVPVIVALDAGGSVFGTPFYAMEKVAGQVIRGELPSSYVDSSAQREALADELVAVLAALHAVDPVEVGLADFGRPEGFLERNVRRWYAQWEASRTADVPAVEALGRELLARVPARSGTGIVHGDFRLDNCMMSLDRPPRVAALLDWEMSTLGDPLTDLGMLLFYWREAGEDPNGITPTVTATAGFPGRAHVTRRYAEFSGRDVTDLAFYEAHAHFKFAVIAQGIAARVAAGSMAGQDFGDLSAHVVGVAERGLARLTKHG